ncbi:hypothetical protein SeLEV6574_g02500 [Synchytrium endobioticum]|uniref:Endonuclease/exonuclease/phosphatase domain-containing protein n=1 Tax=Synchytrium endobioticum TaxID=286115 RepID=A0A507D817_9FUNG|nr:hypothetical protein SeLEV6574_g02500 [Synchytrium endobioticum]
MECSEYLRVVLAGNIRPKIGKTSSGVRVNQFEKLGDLKPLSTISSAVWWKLHVVSLSMNTGGLDSMLRQFEVFGTTRQPRVRRISTLDPAIWPVAVTEIRAAKKLITQGLWLGPGVAPSDSTGGGELRNQKPGGEDDCTRPESGTKVSCSWFEGSMKTLEFMQLMMQTPSLSTLVQSILRIHRVRQSSTLTRFDITCREEMIKTLLAELKSQLRTWWHHREHRTYIRRHSVTDGKTAVAKSELKYGINFMSLTINHVTNKRQELAMLLRKNNVGVLALQETWLTPGSWKLRIKGYKTFEGQSTGKAGEPGVAILVRDDTSAYECAPSSPIAVWVKLQLNKDAQLIVGSIYVPVGKSAVRRKGIEEINSSIKSLNSRAINIKSTIVMMGDFNSLPDVATEYMSRSTRFSHVSGDNSGTFRREMRWIKCIDHIMWTGETNFAPKKCLKDTDISDHRPIMTTLLLPNVSEKDLVQK